MWSGRLDISIIEQQSAKIGAMDSPCLVATMVIVLGKFATIFKSHNMLCSYFFSSGVCQASLDNKDIQLRSKPEM